MYLLSGNEWIAMEQRAKSEKVHVIACGAIAREILAVKALNGLDHLTLDTGSATLTSTPTCWAQGA